MDHVPTPPMQSLPLKPSGGNGGRQVFVANQTNEGPVLDRSQATRRGLNQPNQWGLCLFHFPSPVAWREFQSSHHAHQVVDTLEGVFRSQGSHLEESSQEHRFRSWIDELITEPLSALSLDCRNNVRDSGTLYLESQHQKERLQTRPNVLPIPLSTTPNSCSLIWHDAYHSL